MHPFPCTQVQIQLMEAYVSNNCRAADVASDFMPFWKLNYQVHRLQIQQNDCDSLVIISLNKCHIK